MEHKHSWDHEKIGVHDAEGALAEFCAMGRDLFSDLASVLQRHGVAADFRIESLRPAFEAVAAESVTVPIDCDKTLPSWILDSASYRRGLYRFEDSSQDLIGALSVYLAEVLVQQAPYALSWGIGAASSAIANQPVLEGFKNGVQMAPLVVTQNLIRRIVEENDPGASADVDRAVRAWMNLVGKI